ncbi:MAG: hypothetical protein AMXMBFR64_26160 [Myxococcales bacterium]
MSDLTVVGVGADFFEHPATLSVMTARQTANHLMELLLIVWRMARRRPEVPGGADQLLELLRGAGITQSRLQLSHWDAVVNCTPFRSRLW